MFSTRIYSRVLILIFLCLCSCFRIKSSPELCISNSNLTWRLDYSGGLAVDLGELELQVLMMKNPPVDLLISALHNEGQWIAAHVLLTMIYDDNPTPEDPSTWVTFEESLGLEVVMENYEGGAVINPDQKLRIIDYWESNKQRLVDQLRSRGKGPTNPSPP